MSSFSSAAQHAQKHLHRPRLHREGKTGYLSCKWVKIEDNQYFHHHRELAADVKKALDKLPAHKVSNDGSSSIAIPDCWISKNPCDTHYQALLQYSREHSSGTDQSNQAQSQTLSTEQDLTEFGAAVHSTASDSNERVCDFNDRGPCDIANKVKSECADDGCSADVDADDLEEYDEKEIIRKDEASECHMPIVEVDDRNQKRLKPTFDNVQSASDMNDPLISEITPKGPRTPSSGTRRRSKSSLQTPKNSSSWLQHVHETDLAQKDYFRLRYERSPHERTLKGYITLSVDPSCYEGVDVNEENVRERVMADSKIKASDSATATEGFVYAFRDDDFALVKIGFAADWEKRRANIEKKCSSLTGLTFLAAAKVKAYRRLEEIIHQDLAPHRRFFDCACGKNSKGFTRHQEYFQIDDAAAVSTLQLWADFVEEQPWEQSQSSEQKTCLKMEWRDKLLKPSEIGLDETHGDHDKRIARWRRLLGIPDPKVALIVGPPLPADALVGQQSTVAPFKNLLFPAGTPSKPPRASFSGEADIKERVKLSSSSIAPLEHSSSRNPEGFVPLNNQESGITSRPLAFSPKGDRSIDHNPIAVEKISIQARSMPDQQNVDSADMNTMSSSARMAESQPEDHDPSQISTDSNLTTTTGPLHSSKQPVNTLSQERPTVKGCFADITFNPDFSSSHRNHATSSTQSGNNIKFEQLMPDKLMAAVKCDLQSIRCEHQDEQPGPERNPGTVSSSWDAHRKQAAIIHSPLVQVIIGVATELLAKEVRPMPSRTISADLWQLRWPLACSVAFALQSPHVPSVLSFLMWSIFLPFFVAELRGWRFAAL